jgi:hypothetical protein
MGLMQVGTASGGDRPLVFAGGGATRAREAGW